MRQRKGLTINKCDVTALEWNSMGWGLRCVPAFRILFASSTVPGLIPTLHCSQARRLCAVAAQWSGLSPFPWWCGMCVITLSVVEGTSALSLGLWSKSLAGCGALSGLQEVGILCPRADWCGVICHWCGLVWCAGCCGVMCWLVWFGEQDSVPWHSLSSCHLPTCKACPEWERVGGNVCQMRLPWGMR